MIESTGAFYDVFWSRQAPDDSSLGSHESARLREIERAVGRIVGERHDLSILDIGCGTGWLTRRLARFAKATGIDFSAIAVHMAREKAGGEPVVFAVRDALSEPLDDLGQFNIVVAAEVIEHVKDKRRFLDMCRGALAPGGHLILTTPNAAVWDRYWSSSVLDTASWKQAVEDWVTHEAMSNLLQPHFDLLVAHSYVLDFDDRGLYRIVNSNKLGRVLDCFEMRTAFMNYWEKRWLGLYGIYIARKR